jgi:diguanylate cyclase (GGDEF)-like protein
MSGHQFATSSGNSTGIFSSDSEITPYLEDLASRLKTTTPEIETADNNYWGLIDRVLAYAASAEQHIAEQQMRIRELENMSTTDELTGLNNRRSLRNHLTRVLSRAKRHGDKGIVAFLDMNEFKEINDRFGHDAGDKALQNLAGILQKNLRDTDFVARLGGDEFIFVLEKADIDQGIERAKQIRDIICNSSMIIRGQKIILSASMGLAIYDDSSSYDTLLSAADDAMYRDKKRCLR